MVWRDKSEIMLEIYEKQMRIWKEYDIENRESEFLIKGLEREEVRIH